MFHHLASLPKYRGLIQSLVVRELKARYRGSVLGFFWSFINPLLLRPLPFRDAKQLMWIQNGEQAGDGLSARTFQVGQFEELKKNSRAFDDMSAYFAFFGFFQFTLTGHGEPEKLAGLPVAPRFFEVLGVQPMSGRLFIPLL